MEMLQVIVLGSRLVAGDTVNELTEKSNFIIEKYTCMARAIYKCSRQDPEAAYG
jgi:hypothetical protein